LQFCIDRTIETKKDSQSKTANLEKKDGTKHMDNGNLSVLLVNDDGGIELGVGDWKFKKRAWSMSNSLRTTHNDTMTMDDMTSPGTGNGTEEEECISEECSFFYNNMNNGTPITTTNGNAQNACHLEIPTSTATAAVGELVRLLNSC